MSEIKARRAAWAGAIARWARPAGSLDRARSDFLASAAPLLFFLIINLSVYAASVWAETPRVAPLNGDYAIVPMLIWAMLGLSLPRWTAMTAAIALTCVLLVMDSLGIVTRVYFDDPAVLFDTMGSVADWPWRLAGPIAFGTLAVGGALVIALVRAMRFPRGMTPLVAAIGLFALVDLFSGQIGGLHDLSYRSNTITSAIRQVVIPLVQRRATNREGPVPLKGPSFYQSLRTGTPPDSILSVAVESLGAPRSPVEMAAMLAPLDALRGTYDIELGIHPARGTTFPGEVRELCGLRISMLPRTAAQIATLHGCAPEMLRDRGYRTTALHGNGGLIYHRQHLYPEMGFQETLFFPNLLAHGGRVCTHSMFGGICDRSVYQQALARFDGSKRFVHVMTLDTHLPLYVRNLPDCLARPVPERTRCAYTTAMRRTLGELAAAIVASRHPPELITLYGDHPPPFGEPAVRAMFQAWVVPVVTLRRRHPG